MYWSCELRNAYRDTLAKAGFKIHIYKQPKSRAKRVWGKEQFPIADWLKSLPKPAGLWACTDERSQNVAEACKIANLKIPDDIAILGIGNDELVCQLSYPALSSIAMNTENAGYLAAELLDKMIKQKKIKQKTIIIQPTHIAERQSTNILQIKDPQIKQALRFIQDNAGKLIQVNNVLDEVCCSRRSLDEKFTKTIGQPVYKHIKQTRIKKIIQLMTETNLSISQIAFDMGFSSTDHIARYFKQTTKITPSEYRKKFCN